ncbi:BQ2448_2963 [Microbotryum intermedium]|uniref:BQ2448_2963 protein n=1 Tax=Microbotryum intermedium TaxID=269621 RepID=A0A238FDX0_9BASI|nr:BQ2448_2963 [Microbotryum intermedium]
MASSFVGLPVRCNLRNGQIISGLVAGVDAVRGAITIETSSGGHYDLPRAQVVNLELLSLTKQGEPQDKEKGGERDPLGETKVVKSEERAASSVTGITSKTSKRQSKRTGSNTPAGVGGESKPSTSTAQPAPRPQPHSTIGDFDFGATLNQFDKQREFAAIKSQDDTDPALRLVSHNKQTKLLPSENVLSVAELEQQTKELAASLARLDPRKPKTHKAKEVASLRTKRGVVAPCLTRKQYREVVSIAEIETGPTAVQRTENASRAMGQFILSLHPDPPTLSSMPSLCILCGSKAIEKSTLALRAGTMLVNRGFKVLAFLASMEGVSEVALKGFSAAGGRLWRSLAELPNDFDLVIDAIVDEPDESTEIGAQDLTILRWATKRNQAPMIAIETPSGSGTESGAMTQAYTLHRTALRTPAPSSDTQHIVLDEGISPKLLRRLGLPIIDDVELLFSKDLFVRVS